MQSIFRWRAAVTAIALLPTLSQAADFRVCADPNNLPFSNRAGQGFENKIAERLAHDFHARLTYAWAKQGENFIKHTLKAGTCDVMLSAPAGYDEVATTTPYYASTYVFVSRRDSNLNLSSLTDPRLHKLHIGVHLIGDDATPPAIALGNQGIVNNVTGFMIFGDYSRPNPPARLIEAVENKKVDVAAVWGPLGGYFARQSLVPLTVTPIAGTARFAPLIFRYAIAMGVRKDDIALRDKLNIAVAHDSKAIHAILEGYGVPLTPLKGGVDG
ncbi:MAG TPA: quinoprotein dehydrogenase-associated putative ABC transporter substrate-binding protein [Rhizomicrobium sp.]|nr:quinoprotein dehydrogenase-associated putative ABC transporter substrate-binding protein [Rhizomicrobium sp.]